MMLPRISLLPTLLCVSCAGDPGPATPVSETERKMLGLLEKFDRWDENGDGKLDERELAANLEGTGVDAARVIAFYDTDGDGRISLGEAQAGYLRADEVGE